MHEETQVSQGEFHILPHEISVFCRHTISQDWAWAPLRMNASNTGTIGSYSDAGFPHPMPDNMLNDLHSFYDRVGEGSA